MNIESIKKIVNSSMIDSQKRDAVLFVIAEDKNAMKDILGILDHERNQSKELILDSNCELSRALAVLNDTNLKYNKKIIADPKWVVSKIKEHYSKWANVISCNFNIN